MDILTEEKRDQILAHNGITVLRRIPINPYFMAELVRDGVMTSYESRDIQAEQTPGKRTNALLAHLQDVSPEQFISFCIVLEVKQKRRDIVYDAFGLELRDLYIQREYLRKKRIQSAAGAASAISALGKASGASKVAVVRQPCDSTGRKPGDFRKNLTQREPDVARLEPRSSQSWQPGDPSHINRDDFEKQTTRAEPNGARFVPESCQPAATSGINPDMPDVPQGRYQPEPSPILMRDENDSSIASLSGNMHSLAFPINEYKMLHDPPGETEINSTKLNDNWMHAELKRLRQSLVDKPHKPVVIALLDTGVFTDHPDFNAIDLIIGNRNCVGCYNKRGWYIPDDKEEKDLERDKANHGTMSAGILWQCAGQENVKILNLKVMKQDGSGSFDYISEALSYIKQWDSKTKHMPVDIILMTLGSSKDDSETNKLLSELGDDKILICSASNDGQTKANSVMSPANHGSVIAIGSCDKDGNRCSHSSVGQELDFLFPGENIQSTSSKYNPLKPKSLYIERTGTSFAAPYAAALMALVLCYVETHIKNLAGLDGASWRVHIRKSSEMKKLLRDVCCPREHSYEKGFGAPELQRIRKDGIQAHLKLAFDIPD